MSIVFDELQSKLEKKGFDVTGYADDHHNP